MCVCQYLDAAYGELCERCSHSLVKRGVAHVLYLIVRVFIDLDSLFYSVQLEK